MHDYPFDIPERIMVGITNYVNLGISPGGFLTAVIKNDLSGAIGQADEGSMDALRSILGVFYNETPSQCWGSAEKWGRWLAMERETRDAVLDCCLDWQRFQERVSAGIVELDAKHAELV